MFGGKIGIIVATANTANRYKKLVDSQIQKLRRGNSAEILQQAVLDQGKSFGYEIIGPVLNAKYEVEYVNYLSSTLKKQVQDILRELPKMEKISLLRNLREMEHGGALAESIYQDLFIEYITTTYNASFQRFRFNSNLEIDKTSEDTFKIPRIGANDIKYTTTRDEYNKSVTSNYYAPNPKHLFVYFGTENVGFEQALFTNKRDPIFLQTTLSRKGFAINLDLIKNKIDYAPQVELYIVVDKLPEENFRVYFMNEKEEEVTPPNNVNIYLLLHLSI